MNQTNFEKNEKLLNAINLFWRTIPPIWHITRMITRNIASEEFNLTPSKFHTLRRIVDGKNSISQLSDCLFLSRPNISRTVDELVNEGLVERHPDPEDRRGTKIMLTHKGCRTYKKLHKRISENMMNFFHKLDDEELTVVISGLSSMQKLLNNQES